MTQRSNASDLSSSAASTTLPVAGSAAVKPPLHILLLNQPQTIRGEMGSSNRSSTSSSQSKLYEQPSVMRHKIRRRILLNKSLSRIFGMIVLLSCTKILLLLPLYSAEKDSNPYPYGDNPNNQFKMYWNDAGNVLQDLSKFSALFIKYHGCVWSECHVDQYDDDGEDRDGGTLFSWDFLIVI
jgi:hypothetical protein